MVVADSNLNLFTLGESREAVLQTLQLTPGNWDQLKADQNPLCREGQLLAKLVGIVRELQQVVVLTGHTPVGVISVLKNSKVTVNWYQSFILLLLFLLRVGWPVESLWGICSKTHETELLKVFSTYWKGEMPRANSPQKIWGSKCYLLGWYSCTNDFWCCWVYIASICSKFTLTTFKCAFTFSECIASFKDQAYKSDGSNVKLQRSGQEPHGRTPPRKSGPNKPYF